MEKRKRYRKDMILSFIYNHIISKPESESMFKYGIDDSSNGDVIRFYFRDYVTVNGEKTRVTVEYFFYKSEEYDDYLYTSSYKIPGDMAPIFFEDKLFKHYVRETEIECSLLTTLTEDQLYPVSEICGIVYVPGRCLVYGEKGLDIHVDTSNNLRYSFTKFKEGVYRFMGKQYLGTPKESKKSYFGLEWMPLPPEPIVWGDALTAKDIAKIKQHCSKYRVNKAELYLDSPIEIDLKPGEISLPNQYGISGDGDVLNAINVMFGLYKLKEVDQFNQPGIHWFNKEFTLPVNWRENSSYHIDEINQVAENTGLSISLIKIATSTCLTLHKNNDPIVTFSAIFGCPGRYYLWKINRERTG